MAFTRICMLKPMEAEDKIIHLESGKQIIGRSRETGIRDNRCSKKQLELEVDLKLCKIDMRVLGMNPCSINGVMALQSTECNLKHGDILEIVFGRHCYCVTFKPPPEQEEEDNSSKLDDLAKMNRVTDTENWEAVENGKMIIYTSAGVSASNKIAGYDMDWTLIKTRSGNVFPKDNDDWELMYAQVPKKLQQLHADGFKICIFTNQGGIGKGKITPDDFKKKVRAVVQKLSVPVQLFAATTDGYYRKPLPGMWMYLRDNMNSNVELQLEKCFYVGDAAGRAETGKGASKRRKDHSLVDRLFAANVGVSFYTPEVHFLGSKDEDWMPPTFDPTEISAADMPLLEPPDTTFPAQHCELIVMVGLPGTGKSHFCQQHMTPHNYRIINADSLGSVATCLRVCENTLSSGQSCVVDNTNVTADARKKFVDIARRIGVACRCFVMNVTTAHMKHNIAFRQLTDTTHSKINEMVLNGMKKRYLPPTFDEGFSDVIKVNWKAKFTDTKHEQLYKMYLLEK